MTSSTTRAFMAKKQSTSFAQVANNLLNVLQGYTRGIRLVVVLTMLLIVGIGQAWAEGTETFEALTSASNYTSRSWTGVNGQTWQATLARTDQKITGNRGLTFSDASSEKTITMKLTEAQRAAGIGTFTFKYKHPYSDSSKNNTFSISVNGSSYSSGTLNYTSSTATKTITINAVPNSTSITITITGTARLCVDDFSWTSYVSANPHTVTLNAGPGTCAASVTELSAGAGVTLPTPTLSSACQSEGWSFAGWKTTSAVTTETTTEPTLIPAGAYSPTSNITLYAVYKRTEGGGGGGETEVTKSVSISNYATAHDWNNEAKYTSVTIDENITATASSNPATNTGKYYSSDNSWRFYQNESGKLIITAATGSTLKSITLTFSNKDSGTISYNSNSCTTNAAVAVSGQSATFTVGSSSGSKGKILITNISVTYTTSGGGGSSTTYYHSTPDCGTIEPSTSTYTVKHCKEGLEAGSYPDDLIETETPTGTIGEQVTPGRKNYTGFTAPSGQTETILENGALVITYKYTRKSYTLTWELGDGIVTTEGTAAPLNATGTISQNVRYETPITAPIVQREGYRFNKWDSSVSNTMPANDKSFTATWVKTWNITWKAQGNTIQEVTVDTDSKLTLPTEEVATCEGMTHIGWTEIENYTSDTDAPNDFFTYAIGTVSENKIYHAVYALSCGYTKLDWGSEVPEGKYLISTGTNTIYGQNGTTKTYLGATAYAPTRELKPEYEVYIREVGTAFAIQLLNTMWVGLASSSSTNTNLTIDSPETNADYTWKYTEKGIQNQSATSRYLQINGAGSEGRVYTTEGSGSTWHPTYLYARNNGGYYTTCQTSVAIDYDLNGGTGNMSNTRVKSGSDYIIPTAVPTQVGKTFTHWSDGTNTYAAGATINDLTNDITLTAQWKVAQHTVTLNPNYPDGETGTFTYEAGELVDGNLVLTYDYNTASMTIASLYTSLTLDGYEFGGWYNAKGVNPGAVSGSKCTNTGNITGNKTYYAKWSKLHTVTFNTGTNNPTVDAMEGTSETGITLPAGPTPACSTDGWDFAGWWTESVAETTTSPGELLTAGSNYKPTEDCTLYAVYSKEETEEGGGTTPTEATLSFASTAQRTSFSDEQQVWEQNGIILTNTKGSDNNDANVGDYANPARFYANSEIIIEVSGNITQIVFECTENASELKNSVGVEATYNENIVTIIPTASSNTYTIAKLTKQVKMSSLTVTYLAESGPTITTTYNSNPSCEVCENILTINKGAETNGTFILSQSGEIETCDGVVEVVVTPTPAEHYSVSAVTATTPTTGDAPTVTNNGDGTWTVTYTQNSTGESTINVTFEEDAKASITLSELGVENTDNTTYYVGETYTLPSTSSQSCDGKQLVGWSRVEVAETDTKPTENYYELGAKVTLVAEQTFYAVFATLTAGGEGTVTKINADDDFHYGDKIIIIAENTNYGLYRSSSSNYVSYWETSNNNGVPTPAEIEADSKRFIEISEGTTEGTIKLGNVTDGYLHNPSSTDLSISTTNASDWELIAWNDNTFTFKAIQYLSCRTDLSGTNANKWRGAGGSCNCETGDNCFGIIYYNIYRYTSGSSYTAYTTSCVPTYSITYDFAGGTGSHCSNTSVPQGDSYTICDEAPTKEGHTFLGWSDGINIYQPNNSFTPEDDITLTAQWQINTYTVTWSNNGTPTPVEYNHGVALVVPEAPESCDGVKEFVGWTEDNTFTYHATTPPSDLFTEKTATVTADATYYAVFATKGEGSANFVLGESGTFKMYANVNGTNYYAQGGVSSSKITSTTEAANASDYTLTYADGVYTIKQGTSNVGNKTNDADLNTNETTWTISEGTNGSWRVTSNATTNATVRALSYSYSNDAFKAYATTNIESGSYYDIEFGGTSSGYSDYTTICQQIESIEVQDPQTEFYITDNFTIGSGKVIATLSGGGTTDVTALATFSGYNMNVVGTYTVTVTYMGATATYEINVKPLDNAWVLTWNVSGKTNTGLSPRSVTKGNAIGTLPVPEVPAACEGKTFMGWTESNIVPSDGVGIVYITPETVPTDNTTYYAVFATVNNFCKQMPIEDIESGSKVVVVAVASLTADGGSGKAISSRTISITSQGVIGLSGDEVSISDETINTPHSTCIWTLTKEGGGIVLEQDGKYIRAVDNGYRKLLLETTKDYWKHIPVEGKYQTYHLQSGNTEHYVEWFDHTDDQYDEGEKYIGFVPYIKANDYGDFDMQFFVTLGDGADITDYTTGCEEYTITYYGFRGGYSTSTSSDGIIVLPVNSSHTVPDCGDVVTDHTDLGREFLDVWMTQPHGGHTFKPGDTFILTQDTTLYAQWKLETTSDVTTLPTDIEDMAGTDVYVYGGTALNIQPGSTTINSLTLKGGIQSDGSYKMPTVWVPEGATLIRNSNKIYLDLAINAKNYYPFAVPFATKNDQYIDYLDPVLNEASTYGTHFVIKTYDGARRATRGEDRDNNWVRVLRHQSAEDPSYLQPGVGYIITAMTYPDKDTATIRIPMTVPNTWFENGEQTVVGTTTRNTVSVVGHTGEAAEEHQRHAGWNFVASPYLSNFSGNNIGGEQGYINGWIDVTDGSFPYYDTEVPYVTVPVADFAYYKQTKVAEATLSPEWSFFVQIAADAGGTMNFAIEGRKQAPASVAARYAEERPVKMDVDITLTNGSESDQTGLIICDHYTHEYEIGRDLEKMFGSAYNLVVYSIMQDKTPLAYQALPIQHDMQVIPIGYRAPAKGEYTFSLNATSSIELLSEKYEQLILEDYETGARTNLLEANYTFDSERTQSDTRFVIYPVLRKNTPTDVPNILDNSQTTHKLFHNGHIYIIHEGRVYNGNGQIVK